MSEDRQPNRPSVWELGPKWIGALGTLIIALTGAGFFAGRVTGQPVPNPTVTVTVPATSVAGSPPARTASPQASADTNGALLGSYHIDLAAGYSVPLGPTRPAQSEYSTAGTGDLAKVYSRLQPGGNDQMAQLPDGTAPTYQDCANATDFTGMILPTLGTSFCLIETTGLIAGAEVTAIGNASSGDVIIKVAVWRHQAQAG